ncbi:MAG TPA: DnaT-like ssDNA-binding protein [Longimicrobiales bacterium]
MLDATVGSPTANSYVTTVEADAYFDERLHAEAWTAASADDRARALIQATRRLDQEEYRGVPRNPLKGTSENGPTQALKWPRRAAENDEGWVYEDDIIPTIVKHATMELALAYLSADADPLADTGLEGFARVSIGSLEVEPRHARVAGELPENVRRLLAPVLETSRATVRLVRA